MWTGNSKPHRDGNPVELDQKFNHCRPCQSKVPHSCYTTCTTCFEPISYLASMPASTGWTSQTEKYAINLCGFWGFSRCKTLRSPNPKTPESFNHQNFPLLIVMVNLLHHFPLNVLYSHNFFTRQSSIVKTIKFHFIDMVSTIYYKVI